MLGQGISRDAALCVATISREKEGPRPGLFPRPQQGEHIDLTPLEGDALLLGPNMLGK